VSFAPKEYLLLDSSWQNLAGFWNRNQLIDQVWGTINVVDTKRWMSIIRWFTGKA